MKEIKDYLHLYLGARCKVKGTKEKLILTGVSFDDTQKIYWAYFENTELGYAPVSKVKLVLRNLSDMTEEEYKSTKLKAHPKYWETPSDTWYFSAETTRHLLSKQFDLFCLIEAGLAIDATTLSK